MGDAKDDAQEHEEYSGLPVGTVVDGYRVEAQLGEGGMGRVYRAVRGEEPPVALKVLHPWLILDGELHARFLREAQVGRRLVHPNVVRTYEAGRFEHDGEALEYLAMEFVEGRTLMTLLDEFERVPEELCRHVAREVARGLVAIHEEGVVHRDLKPPNVLLTPAHEIKIMDLGIALVADASLRLSRTGRFIGTVLYAAPEQLDPQRREVDGRADLYALGMMLYEFATGKHPFKGLSLRDALLKQVKETPRSAGELNPQLSPFLEELIMRLIRKDPAERFESAAALLAALEGGEKSVWWSARADEIRERTRRPLRRIRVARESALVGRDDARARFDDLWRAASAGEGKVLILEGEAGIGKSRLLDEFVAGLAERSEQPHHLFGGYAPGGVAGGVTAFAQAVREYFGEELLAPALARYLDEARGLAAPLAAVLRGETSPDGGAPLDEATLRNALVQLVRGLSAEQPTLVMIEDLHFAPEEGWALFTEMARAAASLRVLLVATVRPGAAADAVGELASRPHVVRIPLPRLATVDVGVLLRQVFGSARLAEDLAADITARSAGNPYFVLEILRGLREAGQVARREDGSWVRATTSRRIEIPSSVRELIRQRVADLDEEDRALLEVAACCGFEFDPGIPAAALGEARLAVLERFARLEHERGLVRSVGSRFAFDNRQLQETLYDDLAVALREEYHAAIAEALEGEPVPEGGEGMRAHDLTRHFQEAGRHDRAARSLEDALRWLDHARLHAESHAMAERALRDGAGLDDAARLRILRGQAFRLQVLDRLEPLRGVVEEVVAGARDAADGRTRASVLAVFAGVLNAHGMTEEAETHAREALGAARGAGDDDVERQAWRALGLSLALRGRFDEAREAWERQLEAARRVGRPDVEAEALSRLGDIWAKGGYYDRAIEHHERALEIVEVAGSPEMGDMIRGRLGTVYQSLGRYRECLELYGAALRRARETANRSGECLWLGNTGSVRVGLGEYAAAVDDFEHALVLAREAGNESTIAWLQASIGEVKVHLGRYDDARRAWEASLAFERDTGDVRNAAYSLLGLGELALADGDFEGARERLGEARRIWESIRYRSGLTEVAVSLGRLAFTEGDRAQAVGAFREARDLSREMAKPGTELVATAYLLLLAPDDAPDAAERIAELDAASEHHRRAEGWFVLYRATRERAALDRALECVERAGALLPDEWREGYRLDVPIHREVLRAAGRLEKP